jgi:hypothetical protein
MIPPTWIFALLVLKDCDDHSWGNLRRLPCQSCTAQMAWLLCLLSGGFSSCRRKIYNHRLGRNDYAKFKLGPEGSSIEVGERE